MEELSANVMPAFDAIKAAAGLDIRVSTLGVNIEDSALGTIKGYYGFYSTGAIRIDTSGGRIVQVAIWTKPGDLNTPDYKISISDLNSQLQDIVHTMSGVAAKLEALEQAESRLYEGARDDVTAFLTQYPDVATQKGSEAYSNYMKWAAKTGHKEMSSVYFGNNLRALKAGGTLPSKKKASEEQTEVAPEEQDSFVKDVMDNEIYYKAAMYESLLKRMAHDDPGVTSLFIYGSPGLGKGSANSSLINTPKGRVPMGELKAGDYVTTPKGSRAKILEVHPLGVQQIYQVELSDGACAYVTEDHLWRVKRMDATISRAKKKFGETLPRRWDLLTTKEMMEKGLRSKDKWRFAVPYIEVPYETDEKVTLPLDPYVLGVLLGDGGLSTKAGISFTSIDPYIVDILNNKLKAYDCKLAKDSEKDYRIVSETKENRLNTILKNLNLKEKKSFDKFIPSDYLRASSSDRIALLQGLMDTDGSCIRARGPKNIEFWAAQYYTISPQLKEGVIEIVRSLGGKVTSVRKASRYKDASTGEYINCQDHYRLTISFINPDINPFSLPRKAEKYSACKNTTRTIRSISPVYYEDATCILIDDPDHLYVADDYVVTHNTYTCKKIFRDEGVWDSKVTYKSGSIAGFTGLLQLLWDNRKDKIIVLDDNDSLLVGNIAAANILKAVLNSDPEDRIVSYTKYRRS